MSQPLAVGFVSIHCDGSLVEIDALGSNFINFFFDGIVIKLIEFRWGFEPESAGT